MYQSFKSIGESNRICDRLKALRTLMRSKKVDVFLIPHGDEHRNEYVPPFKERLRWISGFTGSAGSAVIGLKKAALFIDGRYALQAKDEVSRKFFELCSIPGPSPGEWIIQNLHYTGLKVGFDPWLHSKAEINRIEKSFQPCNVDLVNLKENLIDLLRGDEKPQEICNPVKIHPMEYAGVSAEEKIKALQQDLLSAGQDATVLTALDSICWLLNIRGNDIAHSPLVLCFAIVNSVEKPDLFINKSKLDTSVYSYLEPIVNLYENDSESLSIRLKNLSQKHKVIRVDYETCPVWITQKLLISKEVVHGRDLCLIPKAKKNDIEIKGARSAHLRDGIAVCRFFAWLDHMTHVNEIDEISAAEQLELFRRESGFLRDISFDTISGSGPNAAIIHYRVTTESNRKLRTGELFLIDSGAQYKDGTTDITRTVAIGHPTTEMCECFTRVLKGHIAVASLIFPIGTRGADIDPFARRALWSAGLDYNHGTGHGVGSYLSVHEGPHSISKRSEEALLPGMIVSNEPGYYKEGIFGIRIENLMLVKEVTASIEGECQMLTFETLTLAPIDRRLILLNMLSNDECTWINTYHERVYNKISSCGLTDDDQIWLMNACAPL